MSDTDWYRYVSEHGNPPHMRRLSRMPMDVQLRATADLAIAMARNAAGCRRIGNARTGETMWYIPDLPVPRPSPSDWYFVPWRIARRAQVLYDRAVACVVRRRPPDRVLTAATVAAERQAVVRLLARWRDTGRYRGAAARIAPRHGTPRPETGPLPFPDRKRRRGRPTNHTGRIAVLREMIAERMAAAYTG